MRQAAIALLVLLGQVAAVRPSFDVAIIKRSDNLDVGGGLRWLPGGTARVTNLSVRSLMQTAFGTPQRALLQSQIVGGPDWIDSDRYDVTAKIGPDLAALPQAEWFQKLPLLLDSLLQDRFKLKTHPEQRELPVYVVRLANTDSRLGPQLRRSSVDCEQERRKCFLQYASGHRQGVAVNADTLVLAVTSSLERVVIDRTGLTGKYDFDLDWSPDQSAPDKPSIFAALREQLGLRVDADRAPVDVIVIDHVDRPTED